MTADTAFQLLTGGGLVAGIAAMVHFLTTTKGTRSKGAKAAAEAYRQFVDHSWVAVESAANATADVLVNNPVAAMTALLAGDEKRRELRITEGGTMLDKCMCRPGRPICTYCQCGPMVWCAGHDGLVREKDMAWTEDGQRWRCSTCRKPEAVLELDAHDAIKVASAVHDNILASIIPLFPSVPTTPPVDPHDTPSVSWSRAQLNAEALRRGFDTTSMTAFPTKATVVRLLTDTADPDRCIDCEMFGPQHCVNDNVAAETPGAWKARLFERPVECDGRRGNHGHPDVVCAQCCECPPDPMGFDCAHTDDEPDDWSDPHEINGAFGL